MKFRALLISIIIVILTPLPIQATHHNSSIDKLDQISDEALQMVKSSRYDDAKMLLNYFSDQFISYTMENQAFPVDELRIVTVAHTEAVEAMGNPGMNHEQRINQVTRFRLAMDAFTTTQEPLWTEMEAPIMTAFGQVKEAAAANDRTNFHNKLNSFLALYEVIYPSLKLDVSVERIQKMDALVHYIDEYRTEVVSAPSGMQELETLETDLKNLFDEVTEDEADPSLWWVIITTGSIIILTLSYVGYRKYKGHSERERQKNR